MHRNLWGLGPNTGLSKKADWASNWEQASKQHPSMGSASVPASDSCLELLPWFPFMINYNCQLKRTLNLAKFLLVMVFITAVGDQTETVPALGTPHQQNILSYGLLSLTSLNWHVSKIQSNCTMYHILSKWCGLFLLLRTSLHGYIVFCLSNYPLVEVQAISTLGTSQKSCLWTLV